MAVDFLDEVIESRGPGFRAEYEKYTASIRRRQRIAEILFGWTRRVPLVGPVVWVFWSVTIEEGLRGAAKPRWGALTFAFLNDGQGATIWHTWRSITHDNTDPWTGIYVKGAPHSKREALEWDSQPLYAWRHNHGRML